jgi:hypothetical protein
MSILSKVFSAGAGELVKNVGGVLDNLTTTKEQLVLITVIGAYFGGRSLEKVKK